MYIVVIQPLILGPNADQVRSQKPRSHRQAAPRLSRHSWTSPGARRRVCRGVPLKALKGPKSALNWGLNRVLSCKNEESKRLNPRVQSTPIWSTCTIPAVVTVISRLRHVLHSWMLGPHWRDPETLAHIVEETSHTVVAA